MVSVQRVLGPRVLLASVLAAAGCGDDGSAEDGGFDAPPDASADAREPTPITLSVSDGEATLTVDTDTTRFRVERGDGRVVVASTDVAAFEFGTASGGDDRYHSPLDADPSGVAWHPIDFGIERISGTEGVLGDADGRRATLEVSSPAPGVFRMHLARADDVDDVALVRLRLAADDGAYMGLGERFDSADARGLVVPMQLGVAATTSGTNEHHVPVPFFVSSNGYGVFVETREAGAFDVGATSSGEVRATFEGGDLDVFIFVAESPRDVIAAYTRHTGLPRLPPRWAFAPMHWRNEWTDGDEARAEADRIREEDVPCTTFWIDNPWQVSYNDLVFDETRFPEPATLLADLRAEGYVPLLWSTPYLDAVSAGETPTNEAEQLYVMARDQGYLVLDDRSGEPFISPAAPGARGGMIDFTSDAALAFWKSRIAPLVGMGVRAFKLDYGEEILVELLGARPGLRFSDGRTERELHNVYNMLYHSAYRQALDEGSSDGGFLLVRGSAWGGQSVADIVWPGDLDNDFREGGGGEVGGLPAAITALVTLSASGFPSFGSDTGGYRGGMPEREALLRWAEHTAFSPILELGGGGAHHDPWLYDAEAGAIYRTLARAHMDLVPYLRMLAVRASEDGTPPVLSPALAYPDDRGGYADPYAYLLGDDLFVAPVVVPGATTRTVHVPPGTWVHWFTGRSFDGPTDVTVDAPLGTPAVLVRRGAVIPLLPPDVDTLVDVADVAIVDPTDRPYLRAWILPEGHRAITTEEGVDLDVERVTDGLDLTVTPHGAIADVRMRIDLAHAGPPIGAVSAVALGGVSLPEAPDRATVEAGCAGACWFHDGDELVVTVARALPSAVTVR